MRKALLSLLFALAACSYLPATGHKQTVTAPASINVSAALVQVQTDIQQFSADTQNLMAAIAAQTPPPPPPPPPPASTESAEGTQATPGSGTITDASNNKWTLTSATNIQRNGAALPTPFGGWQSKLMVYHNHLVYVNGLDGNWYDWNGSAFVAGSSPLAASFYVAPTGSDVAAGSVTAPFASLGRCQSAMQSSSVKLCTVEASTGGAYDFSSCQIMLTPADNGETWQAYALDPADSAILDGGSKTATPFLEKGANSISIQGLKLQNFTGTAYF